MTPSDISRTPNESLDEYLIRIGDNLELYGLTWTSAANYLNQHVEDEYSESKWRKEYASYNRWKPFLTSQVVDSDEYIKDIQDKTTELQKQKFQFQDQKREYTNIVRQQARFEHLKDEINKAIFEVAKIKPLSIQNTHDEKLNGHAVALFSDWHFGADFKNSLNEYNPSIFRQRVEKLTSKIIKYGKRHSISKLTLGILGDMVSGLIHVSTRVQSSEDVIKQIQIVSETLAEVITKLASHFNVVEVINIIGNHSRTVSNKTESVLKENFEYLIPWYLESRLKDVKNVSIGKDTDGYFIYDVQGEKYVFVHGDLDYVSSCAKTLPQMLGIVPKMIFAGHIHHNTVKEHGRTTVVTNGALVGVDDYAISKRFYAEPMQKFMVLDGSDIECSYDIKLK